MALSQRDLIPRFELFLKLLDEKDLLPALSFSYGLCGGITFFNFRAAIYQLFAVNQERMMKIVTLRDEDISELAKNYEEYKHDHQWQFEKGKMNYSN